MQCVGGKGVDARWFREVFLGGDEIVCRAFCWSFVEGGFVGVYRS